MKVHSIKRNFLVKLCISFAFILSVIATALCITPATANLASANTAPVVMMSEGAQIRKIAPTGIRFSAYVSNTYFTDGVLNDGVEVGMDVSILVNGETKMQTVSTESVKEEENKVWNWAESDKEGYQKFQVAVWYSETATVEQYATDLTANAFVKVGDNAKYANNEQTRSVAQVANAALTDDMLTETVDEYKDVLESFVSATNAIVWETPSLALSGDELSWTGVTGAKGYFVANEKETIHVLATAENENYTVDLTEFAKDGVVSVTAYGDGTTATYTTATDTKNYHYLTGDQIATFNHAIYAEDVVAGNPNFKDIHTNQDNFAAYGTTTYEDGRVIIQSKFTAYAGGWRDCHASVVSLSLAQGLDLSKDGVTIKLKLSSYNGSGIHYITLANPNVKDDSYTMSPAQRGNISEIATNPYLEVAVGTIVNEYEFSASTAQLEALGYENGSQLMTFIVWKEDALTDSSGMNVSFSFDDISYCDMLAEVTDLTVTGDTLSWTAVDGAENYTVYANGNVIAENVTVTSFDLSSLTETANVQVRANDANGKVSSALSVSVYYEVLTEDQLATFDHAGYVDDIQPGNPNVKNAYGYMYGSSATIETSGYKYIFTSNYNGDGTVSAQVCRGFYKGTSWSNARVYVYTITLSKELDLARDGIVIKFTTSNIWGADGTENYFTMLNPTSYDIGYESLPTERGNISGSACPYIKVEAGNSYAFSVSSAQLSALGYADGDTILTFAIWNTVGQNDNNYRKATVAWDDISYCDMLDTPVVTIDGTTASWSAVEGAANYTVSVNGVETTTTELSFDLSLLTENATISVRANSTTEGVVSSPFSATVLYDLSAALRIITFDSEEDLDNIIAGSPNKQDGHYGKWKVQPTYSNGTANFGTMFTSYTSGTGALGLFSVTLPQGLDLTKDGIAITMAVTGTPKSLPCAVALVNAKGNSAGYTTAPEEVGDIAEGVANPYMAVETLGTMFEFKISTAQLGALNYATGDTLITVAVWVYNDQGLTTSVGYGLTYTLDDISYYVE